MKRIALLGSTGSIGRQTLDVARWRGYDVVALAAGRNVDELVAQAHAFAPELVACHPSVADAVRPRLPDGTRLLAGAEGAEAVAVSDVDAVLAAIPGYDGLEPTAAALRAGRDVALANKEAMVVAGALMWEIAGASGARITPVDSEHSALFQALQGEPRDAIARLVLTASGGPFRQGPEDLSGVTPEQALRHPTWSMGPKVTVDSATLFNKGLEVLEAHVLFDVPLADIEVVIHPQSWVHGLVRFTDGNLKAQIGPHDMRLPIQYALEAPARPPTPLPPFALEGSWEFAPPDTERFPSLALAYRAGELGGVAPAYLNAADEVAVEAFLAGRIGFLDIPRVMAEVLAACPDEPLTWEAVRRADRDARALARRSAGLDGG